MEEDKKKENTGILVGAYQHEGEYVWYK